MKFFNSFGEMYQSFNSGGTSNNVFNQVKRPSNNSFGVTIPLQICRVIYTSDEKESNNDPYEIVAIESPSEKINRKIEKIARSFCDKIGIEFRKTEQALESNTLYCWASRGLTKSEAKELATELNAINAKF